MKKNNIGIYKVSFPRTKFIYIGSSFNLSRRLIQTRWALKHNKHHVKKVQDIYNKKNVFYFDVIEYVDTSDKLFLLDREQYYISLNQDIILNKSINSNGHVDKNGENISVGKRVYQYTLEGDFVRGYRTSVQAGDYLSLSAESIRRCCYKERFTAGGYKWSYAKRKKIIDKKQESICKKIIQLSLNYDYINTFNSSAEATRKTNIHIRKNKTQGNKFGGYIWLHEKEYKKIIKRKNNG